MDRRLAGRLARTLTRAHQVVATPIEVPRMPEHWVVVTREFGIFTSPPRQIRSGMTYPEHTVPWKEVA